MCPANPEGRLAYMAVVKINALNIPPQAGPELERRFSERAHTVEHSPGFLGFQLLRPTAGEERYFVVTTWEDEEASAAWPDGDARAGQTRGHGTPGAAGPTPLAFDVAMDVKPAG